ncbi:MAG: sulfatase-like hydrolase/transferase [Planctomycetales bacterium]|nr:sulfatase-like hydrolase/transferase [Planctomycetales bacterium]
MTDAPTVPYAPNPKPAEGAPEGRPGPMVADWRQDQVMPELTRRAVSWIKDRRGEAMPFFLYFPWTSPHAPIVPTAEWQGKTKAGGFGDFMAESDWCAGQVLQALDENGFRENTLVIFTADNGPERYAYDRIRNFQHRSMGELRGLKRDIWDGGHRVPLVIRWPGVVPAGRVSGELISQVDFMATVAAIVGAVLPDSAADDSLNQLDLIKGASSSARTRHVHNTNKDHYAIRKDNWVLINAPTGAVSQVPKWFDEQFAYSKDEHPAALYNLNDDIAQRKNLFAEFPQKVAELRADLDALRTTSQRQSPDLY